MKYLFLFLIGVISIGSFAQNKINQLDENGNKHGLWKGTYEVTHRPRYEGTFEHGKEIGVFTFYDDTSVQTVVATREFNKNDNSAYTIFFDQKKNKVSEGRVINKLHEGEWKYYHGASKNIMIHENYKNGKLDGIRSVYFPTGKIAEETGYVNGVKNGIYKKYIESGILLEDATFKNGEYHGLAVFKDPNGNIVAKGMFKEGKKVGIWEFFENGKKVSEDNFNKQRKNFQKKKEVLPEPNQY